MISFIDSASEAVKKVSDEWQKLAKENSGLVFMECNVEKVTEVKDEYKIEELPTFILFKEGKEIARSVGSDIDKLRELISTNK